MSCFLGFSLFTIDGALMDQWECRDPKMEARTFHMFGHGNSGDIP